MEAVRKGARRVNITFPADVAENLEKLVPRGERNRFVVAATEQALRRERLMKALEVSYGAWTDESHPDLATEEDIERFVRGLRENWTVPRWDDEESEPTEATEKAEETEDAV
ncbi:MAG: hypothetical protein ACYC5O_10475 [Anaerolineae bacterium]